MDSSNKGLISIDILKASAALGVFSYHQNIFNTISNYFKIKALGYLSIFGADYCVPLFFLMSGYCIHLSHLKQLQLHKQLSLKTYYRRRFLRIYPTYLITLLVSIAISGATHYNVIPSWQDFLIHLFCLQGFTVKYFNTINLALWSISIEIAFYMLYPLFYYLRLKLSLNRTLFITFVISTLSILHFSLLKEASIVQHYCVLNMWFSWCTGAYIADKLFFKPNNFNKLRFKIAYSLIAILFIYLKVFDLSYLSILFYQIKILLWTAPLVFILSKEKWLCKHNNFFIKIITCIGLSSYSLYLLHEPLILIKNYFIHTYLPASFQKPAMVIGIIIIPYATWLSYRFVERAFLPKSLSYKFKY